MHFAVILPQNKSLTKYKVIIVYFEVKSERDKKFPLKYRREEPNVKTYAKNVFFGEFQT